MRRVAQPSSRARRQDSLEELSSVQGDEEEQAERGGGRQPRSSEARQEGRSPGRHSGLQADRSGRSPHDGEEPEVRLDPSPGISTERRTVVDVPEPLPYTVKEHVVDACRRPGYGVDDFVLDSVRRGLPSSVENTRDGDVMFGKNLLSAMSTLWSVARLPPEGNILRSRVDVRPAPLPGDHRARPREGVRGARGFPGEGQEDRQQVEEGKIRRDRDARRGEEGLDGYGSQPREGSRASLSH